MRRTGLGRHGRLDDDAGDPLDGLVNLFDVGIVLAVAFLLAGLGLTRNSATGRIEHERTPTPRGSLAQRPSTQPLPAPAASAPATGRGRQVGTVYRLADGRLVLVRAR